MLRGIFAKLQKYCERTTTREKLQVSDAALHGPFTRPFQDGPTSPERFLMTNISSSSTHLRGLSNLQSTPSSGRTQRASVSNGTSTGGTTTAQAATASDQTGYAARTAQYGPLIGAVVGTTDLFETTIEGTYDLAKSKLEQFGDSVTNAGQSLVNLGTAAAKAWTETETAIEHGSEKLSTAAKSLASAREHGAEKVGQWIDEAV